MSHWDLDLSQFNRKKHHAPAGHAFFTQRICGGTGGVPAVPSGWFLLSVIYEMALEEWREYWLLAYINMYFYILMYTLYIYIQQMPGLCPEPQPRQATHHHHHHQHQHRHHHHHHHRHQTLIEVKIFNECRSSTGGWRIKALLKIFNDCRSLSGVGELNPYWRSSMNVEV